MGYHIDGPHTAGSTRRDALGIGVFLLASGALGMAAPAPDELADPDDDYDDYADYEGHEAYEGYGAYDGAADPDGPDGCAADYDEEFESHLAAADAGLGDAALRSLAPLGPPGRLTLPLRRRYRVTARYGVPGNWIAGHHTGIDLAVPRGTPVYAVGAGVVVLARWSGAYGKAVTVRMRDGHYALYAHLSRISVRPGARLRAGTRVGSSGSTGRATGPHLHLEIRNRRGYGSDINPVRYLARRGVRLV
ncbi:M23 family metallopeptidase [Streptomyces sp. NPDC059063]|uniref:M23 family metallopeptidase n=1 Tax=unclassified Streptomyces TaxID=2593676 RepID=UPI003696DD9E